MRICENRDKWKVEENREFIGWDFTYLNNRMVEEPLPWSYEGIIRQYLRDNMTLLDMGTGGGEFLLSLNHIYDNTYVTEGWEPNVKLCKEKLEPLGITVKQVFDDNILEYSDNFFDLIINRHEDYDIQEVKRVLKDNGLFITQQVGWKNNKCLSEFLNPKYISDYVGFDLKKESTSITDNGFDILFKNEYYPSMKFYDVGVLVYFAKVISWEFPKFTVDKYYNKLCEIDREIAIKGFYESFEHRFIIVSQNKK